MMSLKEKIGSILDIWNIRTKNWKGKDSEDQTENAFLEVIFVNIYVLKSR